MPAGWPADAGTAQGRTARHAAARCPARRPLRARNGTRPPGRGRDACAQAGSSTQGGGREGRKGGDCVVTTPRTSRHRAHKAAARATSVHGCGACRVGRCTISAASHRGQWLASGGWDAAHDARYLLPHTAGSTDRHAAGPGRPGPATRSPNKRRTVAQRRPQAAPPRGEAGRHSPVPPPHTASDATEHGVSRPCRGGVEEAARAQGLSFTRNTGGRLP